MVTVATNATPTGPTAAPPTSSPTDAQLGLRARKKLRTERDLQDAALRLMVERGFDHVTTDDIAAEAEVSKTTFYRYFDSKEDVLLGKPIEKIADIRAALDAQPESEPTLSAVRKAVMTIISSYQHDREASLARGRLIRETPSLIARNLEHQLAWEAVLAEFVAGRLRADAGADADRDEIELRSRIVAAIVGATLRATLDYWRDTEGSEDLPTLMNAALGMLAEQRAALVSRS